MKHELRKQAEDMLEILAALDQKTSSLLVQGAETERRLEDIEAKMQEFLHFREKFLDWLGQYSRKLEDVRSHRDEARVSFESVYCKLEDLDQDVRLIKAAVRDVDRRYESLQKRSASAGTTGGAVGAHGAGPKPEATSRPSPPAPQTIEKP